MSKEKVVSDKNILSFGIQDRTYAYYYAINRQEKKKYRN